MPSSAIDMNFWPSWAPCRKERHTAQMSWKMVKKPLAFARDTRAKSFSTILTTAQPSTKPATSEKTMP